MLLSELEERGRRFKLALRAGIPVLLLLFLVFYALFIQNDTFEWSVLNGFLLAGIIFITVYFIYFLIELAMKESMVDQTTQSYTQKAFVRRISAYKPDTIVLLVIRNLAILNENYNHEHIDMVLYTLIHKLNTMLKEQGFHNPLISRRFGAEFTIALDSNYRDIQQVFEKFIEENKIIDNIELDCRFAAITESQGNIEQILGQLKDMIITQKDAYTLEDKNKGQNVKRAKDATYTENEIIDALNDNRLHLAFKPLYNTHTSQIDSFEIASKLLTKKGEEILPRIFLPIINRLGMGIEYDLTLFEHIIQLLPKIDQSISLSFNLSPFSLRNKNFQKKFFDLIEYNNIDPSRLIIELYERKTHHDLSGYFETLNTFRNHGIRICIDNFGSTNASMEYMKHFKFDVVQFDRTYVMQLEDSTTYAMFDSFVAMAKNLHITTVAKWVDNEIQKRKLIEMGIDYLQGFGIGKPIDEETILKKYK